MKSIIVINCLIAIGVIVVLGEENNFNKQEKKRKYEKKIEDTSGEREKNSRFINGSDYFNRYEHEKDGYKMASNDLIKKKLKLMEIFETDEISRKKQKNYTNKKKLPDHKVNIPDHVDWRKVYGRVGRVKDQGSNCRSSWAFAATGVLEGQLRPRNIPFIELSEQNLIDCSNHTGGCYRGGDPWYAIYDIAHVIGGIESESSYRYEGRDRECRFNRHRGVMKVLGPHYLDLDERQLKRFIAEFGPVATTIDATHSSFKTYRNGVYYEPNCRTTNDYLTHNVLIVGYGTERYGGDYWLVKNSWGRFWGDYGYIKMARNRNNHCGIATYAVVPTF